MAVREKPAGYCGIENAKFAKRTGNTYATELIPVKYATGLTLNSQVEPTEQHGDNRLLFRIPSDTGLDGELSTTAADPELEKAAGLAIEGAGGLIGVDMTQYLKGALYFEHIMYPESAAPKKVKVWLLNAELGRGSESHTTNKKSVELGTYAYPIHVYGDPLMTADGLKEYLDENGMGHKSYRIAAYPGDTDYATFGDAVPVPKVLASGGEG